MKDISALYQNPKTFTDWLGGGKHSLENKTKPGRLKLLNQLIDLPIDEVFEFDFDSDEHKSFVEKHSGKLCCIRLIPRKSDAKWLRIRGIKIKESRNWIFEQNVETSDFVCQYVFHSEKPIYSLTFVINDQGIYGEYILGGHHQLTRGIEEMSRIIKFTDQEIPNSEIVEVLKHIEIKDPKIQKTLKSKLQATFWNNYIKGYFEVSLSEYGLQFGDYNRLLIEQKTIIPNLITGKVQIVDSPNTKFKYGNILVSYTTNPDLLPLMIRARAIITEQGGLLSHAAIVAREFGIPCLPGIPNITKILRNGQKITIDLMTGMIK